LTVPTRCLSRTQSQSNCLGPKTIMQRQLPVASSDDRPSEFCPNVQHLRIRQRWASAVPEPGHTAGCTALRCAICHDPAGGRLAVASS
jgi:hypothetical protein